MMIDVTIAAGFDGTFAQVFAQMNPLAAGAEMLWHSPQRAVFRDGAGVRIVDSKSLNTSSSLIMRGGFFSMRGGLSRIEGSSGVRPVLCSQ